MDKPTFASVTVTIAIVDAGKYPRLMGNPIPIKDPQDFFAAFGEFLDGYKKTHQPKRSKTKRHPRRLPGPDRHAQPSTGRMSPATKKL